MKIIEIIAHKDHTRTVRTIAQRLGAEDFWVGPESEDSRRSIKLLVDNDERQSVLDALQSVIDADSKARIVVSPVEATLPENDKVVSDKDKKKYSSVSITREELYNSIEKGARLDFNFMLLVFLSTIVAAIGLLKDNVAVIIGAMVIAPLLGPNLALALGAAMGRVDLTIQSLKTGAIGLAIALVMSFVIGLVLPINLDSHELMARTDVGLDSLVLALASGAAAVLSLTTGLPSILVGVMVAVALLPPAAALGLMLGAGQLELAWGATLLLAINVVAVNLSAKLVFLARGVKPRTWMEKEKARQSMIAYIAFWVITLGALVMVIYLRKAVEF